MEKRSKNETLIIEIMKLIKVLVFSASIVLFGASPVCAQWQNVNEEGSFLVYRRQSLIGEEKYSIISNRDSIIVKSIQGENERGRITGDEAELHLNMDLSPIYYENRHLTNKDTSNNLKIAVRPTGMLVWELEQPLAIAKSGDFFPVHSEIPAAMEMMLYRRYFDNKRRGIMPILPRGAVSISFSKKDTVTIKGKKMVLDRYVVEGINWGGRTVWLDASKNLIAVVKANTQIREMIRKGYEEAKPVFIAGNVEEEMAALAKYTRDLTGNQSKIKALVGADIVDGLSDITKKDMTLIIENNKIKVIGKRAIVPIPRNAAIIDVRGKTLIPGLWDMHAHSNQVQWAPAYLAGGITSIRDNGNEVEFATAFRDAIAFKKALGPDIILAGMTDGEGIQGNGIIRARTPKEAREVVAMYYGKGYKQIKIYNSIEPGILKILTEEAHKRGLTVTGHVPTAVGNAREAVESGMDMLSHRARFLSVLFPGKNFAQLGKHYLTDNKITPAQVDDAIQFLLQHKTVLDPTIALDVTGNLTHGTPIETVEPDAPRIAYELFEGKRFKSSVSAAESKKMNEEVATAMQIIGDFYHAGVPIVAGTDNAVPVFSLYLEIETYNKLGKLTPFEALRTATIIPAQVMQLDKKTGTLEPGKEADIAILEKNPLEDISNLRTVSAVVTNGNYYKSEPLFRAAGFSLKTNDVKFSNKSKTDTTYDPEARLKDLGIELPSAPKPVANYVNGVRSGNLIFLAGKGPRYPDGKEMTGKLGQDVTIEEGYKGARLTAINQLAVLKDMLGDLKKVKRIVKVLGFVNSDPAFVDQPKVINGFSDLMVAVFGERGKHARAAIGVASLPRAQAVEIELVVEVED